MMIDLIKKQLKLLFANRMAVITIMAAPLLLTFLFSYAEGNNVKEKLYIVKNDNSIYAKDFISLIKDHKDFEPVFISKAEARKDMKNQTIPLVLIINKNLNVKILQNYESDDSTLLVPTITRDYNTINKVKLDASNASNTQKVMNKLNNSSKVSISELKLNKNVKNQDTVTVSLIGFTSMFIWFVVFQSFRTLLDEREKGTYKRLLTTPLKYRTYLISKVAGSYIFSLINVIIIVIAGKYLLKVNMMNNPVNVLLIFAAYLICLIGITMLFVPFIKNHQSFTMVGGAVMAVTGILGGAFMPIDELAKGFIRYIIKLTPESWVIGSLKNVIFNGSTLNSQLPILTSFVAVGIVCMVISFNLINNKFYSVKES